MTDRVLFDLSKVVTVVLEDENEEPPMTDDEFERDMVEAFSRDDDTPCEPDSDGEIMD